MNDEILHRIPIFCSPSKSLSILSFPASNQLLTLLPTQIRVKSIGLELDYLTPAAKSITFTSPAVSKVNSTQFVAHLHKDRVVLAKVDTYMMKPCLKFIDVRKEEEARLNRERLAGDADENEVVAKAYGVTVRAADDLEGKARDGMQEIQRALAQEPWKTLEIHQAGSEILTAGIDQEMEIDLAKMVDKQEYLNMVSQHHKPALAFTQTMSLSETVEMSMKDRLLGLMMGAHVVDHFEIERLLGDVKFEILGLALKNAYQYGSAGVSRKEWCESTGIDGEVSLNMIREICTINDDRKWILKVPRNESRFADRFAQVNERQAEVIKANGLKALETLNVFKVEARRKSLAIASALPGSTVLVDPTVAPRNKVASRRVAASKKGAASKDNAPEIIIPESVKSKASSETIKSKAASSKKISQKAMPKEEDLQDESRTADIGSSSKDDVKPQNSASKALKVDSAPISVPPVTPSINDTSEVVPFDGTFHLIDGTDAQTQSRNLAIKIVSGNSNVCPFSILRNSFNAHLTQEGCLFSASDLDDALQTVCSEIRPSLWILKESLEELTCKWRPILILHFMTNDKVKKSEMLEIWRSACGGVPSTLEYTKTMQELCVCKGGVWTLKNLNMV